MSGLGSVFGGLFGRSKPSDPVVTPPKPITPPPVNTTPNATPWMDWYKARDGWTEFDHDKELSKGWKYTGLDYTTVQGSDHAWCAMALNSALIESGYKGNGSAAADSFRTYGRPCDWVFGAIIPIRHSGGSHHVTTFVRWIDEKGKIALCRGGNQSNAINETAFNLSGNASGHDECLSGPRWPVA